MLVFVLCYSGRDLDALYLGPDAVGSFPALALNDRVRRGNKRGGRSRPRAGNQRPCLRPASDNSETRSARSVPRFRTAAGRSGGCGSGQRGRPLAGFCGVRQPLAGGSVSARPGSRNFRP